MFLLAECTLSLVYFFFLRTSIREPAAILIAAPIPIAIITVGICIGCVVVGCGVLPPCCGFGVALGVCDGFGDG